MPHSATQGPKTTLHRAPLALIAAFAIVGLLAFGASTAFAATPTLSVDPGPTAAYTTASVSGVLDPADHEVYYWFQYSQDPTTEGWSSGPGAFTGTLAANSGSANVSETLTGLKPGTEYQVRLLAFNSDFSGEEASEAPYVTFTTEPVATPTVTLDPITTHTGSTAHFSGAVDPNAPAGPLSLAAEAAFKTEWHFQCNPECPGLTPGSIEAGEGSQTVSVDAMGLEPNTSYEVTLEASNAGGPSTAGPDVLQTTLIPATVKTAPGASDGEGGYILQGAVNPHNSEVTACHFEYGLSASYGQSVPCKGTPGTGNKFVEVTAHPTGLTPGTAYHFQIVATNGAGPVESGDGTFIPTLTSAETCPNEALRAENNSTRLPECRAYELMTPSYKEGFASYLYGYSDDGAFTYTSTGNFAGNGLGGIINEYVATRSATGWKNASPNPSGPTYLDPAGGAFAMSSDLRSSIWLMRRPGQPANVADFYLRGPDGAFTRIGPSNNPAILPPQPPGTLSSNPFAGVAGASADLSHVLFTLYGENGYPGDTSLGTSSLYEYVGTGNERPQLVGVDNAGHQITLENTCPDGISTDGRVVFFSPSCSSGQVWARIDATTSIEASASECTRTAGDPGGLCNAPAPAEYAGAASDGSRVFFTTTQQLVNGDTDQTNDLYECDIPPGTPAPVGTANPCSSLTEVSGPASGANVEDVVRVSEDGSRVYFVAKGVLAANLGTNDATAVAGDNNLYVWQKDAAHPAGQTTFVAKLQVNDIGFGGYGQQTTADGRYLVFTTANQLLPSDTDEAYDVYRYDADTGALLRLSTDTSGTGGNTPGFNAELTGNVRNRARSAMTSDGSTVIFTTSEALSPADTNGTVDVYEWHDGQVSLISSGRPSLPLVGGITDALISASGTDIYFNTTAQLTPGDSDTIEDFYDARVDGGFSFAKPAPCSGEGCHDALAPQPQTPGAPASATFTGAGNLATSLPSAPAPRPKSLTRAQKLARALKACKSKHNKKKRAACEKKARATYRRGK